MTNNNGLFPFFDAPIEEYVTLGDSTTGTIKNLKKIKDITVLEKQYVEEKLKELESGGLADPLNVLEDLLSDICKKEAINRDEAEKVVTFFEEPEETEGKKAKGFNPSSRKSTEKIDKTKEINKKRKQVRDKYIGELNAYSKIITRYNEHRKYYQAYSIVRYRLIPLMGDYDKMPNAERDKFASQFLEERGESLVELLSDFWEKEATHWREPEKGKPEESPKEIIAEVAGG